MDEEAQGAACFKHRAVASMLRKERPQTLAPRPHAKAGTARIGKETDFHLRMLSQGGYCCGFRYLWSPGSFSSYSGGNIIFSNFSRPDWPRVRIGSVFDTDYNSGFECLAFLDKLENRLGRGLSGVAETLSIAGLPAGTGAGPLFLFLFSREIACWRIIGSHMSLALFRVNYLAYGHSAPARRASN